MSHPVRSGVGVKVGVSVAVGDGVIVGVLVGVLVGGAVGTGASLYIMMGRNTRFAAAIA